MSENFDEAARCCKVRGYIAQASQPDKKYWKDHYKTLWDQVPDEDQASTDWDCHDPEGEATSIVG